MRSHNSHLDQERFHARDRAFIRPAGARRTPGGCRLRRHEVRQRQVRRLVVLAFRLPRVPLPRLQLLR
eukprot:scaffold1292_cov112-Isochrysis_galbana.AAC.3